MGIGAGNVWFDRSRKDCSTSLSEYSFGYHSMSSARIQSAGLRLLFNGFAARNLWMCPALTVTWRSVLNAFL